MPPRSSEVQSSVSAKAAESAQSPAASDDENLASGDFYRRHCVKSHGADSTGRLVRPRQPEILDFTDPVWQAERNDTELVAAIRVGKEPEMPRWGKRITACEARALVAYLRTFARVTRCKE
jgi:mono/diheme cytochrome c family protein